MIMEHLHKVSLYGFLEFLIEFRRKAIGPRCFVMLHVENRILDLLLYERGSQKVIFRLGHLSNVLCPIIQTKRTLFRFTEKIYVEVRNIFL
jgi:hypothetical protein